MESGPAALCGLESRAATAWQACWALLARGALGPHCQGCPEGRSRLPVALLPAHSAAGRPCGPALLAGPRCCGQGPCSENSSWGIPEIPEWPWKPPPPPPPRGVSVGTAGSVIACLSRATCGCLAGRMEWSGLGAPCRRSLPWLALQCCSGQRFAGSPRLASGGRSQHWRLGLSEL